MVKNFYIVSVDKPSDRIDIQFVPKKMAIKRAAAYAQVMVVGRNLPFYIYTGGTTQMELELDFFAAQQDRKDVLTKVRWLESFGYDNGSSPPSRLKIIFGDIFKTQLWTVLDIEHDLELFHGQYGNLPQQAYVKLRLGLDMKKNIVSSDVRKV